MLAYGGVSAAHIGTLVTAMLCVVNWVMGTPCRAGRYVTIVVAVTLLTSNYGSHQEILSCT